MKKIVLSIIFLIIFIQIFSLSSLTISTESKSFLVGNNSVGYRDLIMFSSLAYENLPSSCTYNKETGIVSDNCMFKQNDILGLSNEKIKSMTRIPTSYTEDGQSYYFYRFADISELDGWKIVDYSEVDIENNNYGTNKFVAYTFNKKNDYVITYRGNEYLDVLEWGQEISKNVGKVFSQIYIADSYANKIYSRVSKECDSCSIYLTGHSLGGYLAQSAGASLVKNISGYNLLKEIVYYNSPGISTVLSFDNSIQTQNIVKEKINNLKKFSSSNNKKLILYTIKGDPISLLGKHYGQVRQIDPSLSAIEHHENFIDATVQNAAADDAEELTGVQKLTQWIDNLNSVIQTVFGYDDTISEAQLAKKNFNSAKIILNLNSNSAETSGFSSTSDPVSSGTSLIKNNINKTIEQYNITGINELLSISHEPDSFLCITEGGRGKPEVTFTISDSNNGKNLYHGTKVNNKFYTRGYFDIKLTANITNGCATEYQWQRCSIESNENSCRNISGAVNSSYTIPSSVISNINRNMYYRLKVSYGNSYLKGTLNSNGEYIYQQVNENNQYFYTNIQTIVKDTTGPECSAKSISINRGDTGIVTVNCEDNIGMRLDLSDESFSRNRIYASIKEISNRNPLEALITIKQGWLALGSTKFTIKPSAIKDYAGNVSNSFSFTVER